MTRPSVSVLLRALAVLAAVAVLVLMPARRDEAADRAAAPPHGGERWSRLPGDGKPVREPNRWFYLERAWPDARIDQRAWRRAQAQARALADTWRARPAVADRAVWQQLGPTNIGGRITCVAVDPRDGDTVYAGAAEGGLMRSGDGGQTWDLVFDDQPSLAIGAVALDPVDPDIVYVGTGEVNPGGGSVAYGGTGVYRSLDQGATWTALGLESSGSIGRIVIDPSDTGRMFVAAMGDLWSGGPDRGVYRTTDGGATWELVLHSGDTTGCVDLVLRPDQPGTVLAALWQRERTPERYDYGGAGCAVWRTDDGGDSWSVVGGGLPLPSAGGGRIGLTLCASQPHRMYAVYADNIGYFDGLYRSDDGGAAWSRVNDGALASVFSSYGWWFGNVRCHPDNPDIVFVLGLDFYRSLNGGATWSETSGGMHVDHHGLAWGPAPARVLYNGNDGGVYRSTNGGSAWTLLPDQPITQVYRLGLDANNQAALYLGAQDNSTVRTLTGQLDDWTTIFGGDGFQPLIHPLSSSRIWVQYQYGNVYYSSNGGASFGYAGSGISSSDRSGWNAPHVQDPTDPDTRYFGTNRLYRNVGNTAWTAISGDLTDGPHQNQNGQVRGTLTGIAVSPVDGQVLWTGSDDGLVHVSESGGAFWANVSAGVPERWVTSVRCDPADRRTAYVTVSGMRWDEPQPHVLRTTDLGATWQAIDAGLPDGPVNDLLPHPTQPGRLFVATDLGVYETLDGGASWQPAGEGLPNVVVNHLAWRAATSQLVAGTYGRSVFGLTVEDDVTAADQPVIAGPGRLLSPYPNPSSGGTTLAWNLAREGTVTVDIVTVSGRRVRTATVDAAAGPGALFWDGRDGQGRPVAAGTYLARVMVGGRLVGSRAVALAR
jgi:photosystem II stability/assembly factor-like uncharacterized protein